MSKGYIVIAQNSGDVDYLEQAYALALSIKLTQSRVNQIAVAVDNPTREKIRGKHKAVFDHILEIPWGDQAADTDWKIDNKWKYFHMTPFDETVVLDTDMLFPTDVSHWWDTMAETDFWATTNVRTYRGNIATGNFYRRTFTANNLPNVYTAFMYFRKSRMSAEIFKMAEIIFRDWEHMFWTQLGESKPDQLSGDVAFALAIKILGYEHVTTRDSVTSMPTFVHMKSRIQDTLGDMHDDWTQSLPTYFHSVDNFKIGNYQQIYPFHYSVKHWLTPEIITSMEMQYGHQ